MHGFWSLENAVDLPSWQGFPAGNGVDKERVASARRMFIQGLSAQPAFLFLDKMVSSIVSHILTSYRTKHSRCNLRFTDIPVPPPPVVLARNPNAFSFPFPHPQCPVLYIVYPNPAPDSPPNSPQPTFVAGLVFTAGSLFAALTISACSWSVATLASATAWPFEIITSVMASCRCASSWLLRSARSCSCLCASFMKAILTEHSSLMAAGGCADMRTLGEEELACLGFCEDGGL